MNRDGDNNGDGDGESFRQSFASALASALQENETKTLTSQEQIHETYVQLCHDEPYNLTATGCELLADELIKVDSEYALCDRLLQGLEQVLRKPTIAPTTSIEKNAVPSQNTETMNTKSFSRAVSYLAWTIHIRIPLACLNACTDPKKTLDDKRRFTLSLLGSYHGKTSIESKDAVRKIVSSMHEKFGSLEVESALTSIDQINQSSESEQQHDPTHPATNDGESDSMQEVWAADSDPDDFEFESDYNYQDELKAVDQWAQALTIDPFQLSKASSNATWGEIAIATTSLLASSTYSSHFSGLSDTDWKDSWKSCWMPLIMTLLVLPDTSPQLPIWENESSSTGIVKADFQQLGLHLTQISRDAAADRPQILRGLYIELLRQLLQVQSAQECESQSCTVLPASWVGMGSLSALCDSTLALKTQNPSQLRSVQAAVLESCEDLTIILESAQNDNDTYAAIQWAFVSFFRMLTAPSLLGTIGEFSSSHGQTLLQSGMYRQYLLHWLAVKQPIKSEVSGAKQFASTVLWELCVASPALIGKYTWRFPGVAAALTNADVSSNLVDTIAWNLLGIHLSANDAPRMTMRNMSSIQESPDKSQCQFRAWSNFQLLCKTIENVLHQWKSDLQDGGNGSLATEHDHSDRERQLKEFSRFSKLVAGSRMASRLLVEEVAPRTDGKDAVALFEACLQPIRTILHDWPSDHIDGNAKQEDDDDSDGVLLKKRGQPLVIQEVRTSIKTLSTVLLNKGEPEHSASKAD